MVTDDARDRISGKPWEYVYHFLTVSYPLNGCFCTTKKGSCFIGSILLWGRCAVATFLCAFVMKHCQKWKPLCHYSGIIMKRGIQL